jgi:iron complex transport system substrate-binding protein
MTKNKPGRILVTIAVVAIESIALIAIWGSAGIRNVSAQRTADLAGMPSQRVDSSPVSVSATAVRKQPDVDSASLETSSNGSSRVITDMAGRRVTVPKTIVKVLSTSPPPTTFIYMLAPEKLGGWIGLSSRETTMFIPKKYRDIPVFGWSRRSINYEAYIAAQPDIVFVGGGTGTDLSMVDLTQEKFGAIPVVCVDNTRNATGYGETIRFIGNLLGVPDRAEVLITYYRDVLDEVRAKTAAIADQKRVRVYYAEGNNGLSTDPSGSPHAQLIDVCGGENVANCALASGSGMTPVTIESVLVWKPDVIITTSREFAAQVYNDKTWKKIPAVRNHHVYLTPNQPYNWFDRPPGVNRIVGIPWTAHILYPDIFPEDWFRRKAKKFYEIYYHYNLSDEELESLLGETRQ